MKAALFERLSVSGEKKMELTNELQGQLLDCILDLGALLLGCGAEISPRSGRDVTVNASFCRPFSRWIQSRREHG